MMNYQTQLWISVLVVALWATPTKAVEGGVLRSWCAALAQSVTRPFHRQVPMPFTPEEESELQAWARWNSFTHPGNTRGYILAEQSLLIFSDLAEPIRKKLLMNESGPRPISQIQQMLQHLGISPRLVPALDKALDDFHYFSKFPGNNAYLVLDEKVKQVRARSADEQIALREEAEKRMQVREIEANLSDPQNYRMKLTDKSLQVGKSSVYPVLKRHWNGNIAVAVPIGKVIGPSPNPDFLAANYASTVVRGTLGPEGYAYLWSPTDFARAFLQQNRELGYVPVTLAPAPDKTFYSLTHYELLRYYHGRIWEKFMKMSEERRSEVLDRVRVDPVGYASQLFRQHMKR